MRLTTILALVLLIGGAAIAQTPAPPAAGQPAAAAPAPAGANTVGLRIRTVGAQPDTPGIGPYPAMKEMAPNGLDVVVYRPRDLNALGTRKLGVHVWGNGGCAFDGAMARFHLTRHRLVRLRIAGAGRILSGPGSPPRPQDRRPRRGAGTGAPRATAERMLAALDWILAENARQGSPYFRRIDTARIAASGNSCGGLLALKVGQDPRSRP